MRLTKFSETLRYKGSPNLSQTTIPCYSKKNKKKKNIHNRMADLSSRQSTV